VLKFGRLVELWVPKVGFMVKAENDWLDGRPPLNGNAALIATFVKVFLV